MGNAKCKDQRAKLKSKFKNIFKALVFEFGFAF